MALDKTCIINRRNKPPAPADNPRREYTIDTVPGDVTPDEEFEYSILIRKLIREADFDLGYHTIVHPASELVEKLIASAGAGGVTLIMLPPVHTADVVLTDVILTRSFDKVTFTFTAA